MIPPTLSPRLNKISELINDSDVTADIGTDHAYLPVSLVYSGKSKYVIASDIKTGPIKRAESTVKKYDMSDFISLRQGAGLETITPGDNVDTIVIAGMGGLVVSSILENSPEILNQAKKIILQPMTMVPELRDYLYKGDFKNIKEYLAVEENKIYNIISAEPGKDKYEEPSPVELFLGRSLINERPEHFSSYVKRQENKVRKIIDGLSKSSEPENIEKIRYYKNLLSDIEKFIIG